MSTLVGDAYVRLTVNSRGMKNAVRRAGQDAGKFFGKGFDERLRDENDKTLKRMMDDVVRATAKVDFSQFENQFGSVEGAVVNVNDALKKMERQGVASKKSISDVSEALDDWSKERNLELGIEKMVAEERKLVRIRELSSAAQVKHFADEQRAWEKYNDEQIKGLRAYEAEQKRSNDDMWKIRVATAKAYEAYLGDIERERIKQDARITRIHESSHKVRMRQIQTSGDAQLKYWSEITKAVKNNDYVTMRALGFHESRIGRVGRAMNRFGDKIQVVGNGVGRVFGKGSRNNFLNFFGSAVAGLFAPLRGVIELVARVGEGIGTIVENFKLARMGGASVFGAMRSFLPVLGSMGAGLVGIGVAVAGLSVVLPALVSGVFLLAGGIVAVVSAISMGLLGGLLAMGPLALAAAAGVGALIMVISRMTDEGTKAKKSMDRISEAWKRATNGMEKQTNRVADAIADVTAPLITAIGPLLKNMLGAIEVVIRNFGSMMASPEIKGFMDLFATRLPGIFTNLGVSINNIFGGILGLFAAVLPQADSMAAGFERLTQRFLDFTKSPEGQGQIKDWMDTAWGAAQSLWSILGNVSSILGKIFRSGTEGAGQSFLTYIDDITARFDAFLSSPNGKTAVQDFWKDVREVMVTVKDILVEVGLGLDGLDTEKARGDFTTFMEAVVTLSGGLNDLADAMGKVRDVLPFLSGPSLLGKLAEIRDGTSGATDKTNEWKRAIDAASGSTSTLSNGLNTGKFDLDRMKTALDQNTGSLSGVTTESGRLQGALGASRGALGTTAEALRKTGGKADELGKYVRNIPATKPVRVDFSTTGYALLKQQGDYYNSLRSKEITVKIRALSGIAGMVGSPIPMATGRTVYGPTHALIGEAGPEAVVPLNRPLSQVDPSVRALSAIAQGKAYAGGGVAGGKQTIVQPGAIVVQTSTANPRLVAESVLDRIVAGAF